MRKKTPEHVEFFARTENLPPHDRYWATADFMVDRFTAWRRDNRRTLSWGMFLLGFNASTVFDLALEGSWLLSFFVSLVVVLVFWSTDRTRKLDDKWIKEEAELHEERLEFAVRYGPRGAERR